MTDLSWGNYDEEDLDAIGRALIRERVIRKIMIDTGESREIVVEQADAAESMGQEAVLELTEGEPTTLADALRRYAEEAETRIGGWWVQVAEELTTLLNYPWSGEEALVALHRPNGGVALHIGEGDDRDLEIKIGDNRWPVITVNWELAGSGGQRAAEDVARAVHRAVLVRVLADRDHIVQLNSAELAQLRRFLTEPNGSHRAGDRLSVDACGGGVLVRTRPYTHQRPGMALAQEQDQRDQRAGKTWCGTNEDGQLRRHREHSEEPLIPPTHPDDVPGQG